MLLGGDSMALTEALIKEVRCPLGVSQILSIAHMEPDRRPLRGQQPPKGFFSGSMMFWRRVVSKKAGPLKHSSMPRRLTYGNVLERSSPIPSLVVFGVCYTALMQNFCGTYKLRLDPRAIRSRVL